jgi:hypothetical protein
MKANDDRAELRLDDLTFTGNLAFAGRPLGEQARLKADLDTKDHDDAAYAVEIPVGTVSFTLSFFLGMFDDSVLTLGAEKFRKKYKFVGEPYDRVIEQGIGEALVRGPVSAT